MESLQQAFHFHFPRHKSVHHLQLQLVYLPLFSSSSPGCRIASVRQCCSQYNPLCFAPRWPSVAVKHNVPLHSRYASIGEDVKHNKVQMIRYAIHYNPSFSIKMQATFTANAAQSLYTLIGIACCVPQFYWLYHLSKYHTCTFWNIPWIWLEIQTLLNSIHPFFFFWAHWSFLTVRH